MSVPSDASFMKDQANQLLSFLSGAFAGAEDDQGDPSPIVFPREAVYIGHPPMDCEMLAVWVSNAITSTTPTSQSVRPIHRVTVPVIKFGAMTLRCVTAITDSGTIPPAQTIQQESDAISIDGWVMFYSLVHEAAAGQLFPDLNCQHLRIGTLLPIIPQGGLAGYQVEVEVPLG